MRSKLAPGTVIKHLSGLREHYHTDCKLNVCKHLKIVQDVWGSWDERPNVIKESTCIRNTLTNINKVIGGIDADLNNIGYM